MTNISPNQLELLIHQPEELFYRSCYAPVDLSSMLADARIRSKIRRLPVIHVYFPMKELDDEEIDRLLPQITEEQWCGILDLDLWSKDEVCLDQFLSLIRHLLNSEDAVAKKLLRGTDPEVWQLLVRRYLKVFPRLEEDEFDESEHQSETTLPTPDGNYLLGLPRDAEQARLLRLLIIRLYQLVPDWIQTILYSSQYSTAQELEENLYVNRKRRIEEMGFLDYFDAIRLYTPVNSTASLPRRLIDSQPSLSQLPIRFPKLDEEGPLFLFSLLAEMSQTASLETYIEDLFFLCNKILSADQISPEEPGAIKKTVRKALSGVSLGLEVWSESNPVRAIEGIVSHPFEAFFQIGYQTILQFRSEILAQKEKLHPEPGSFLGSVLEGLLARYPILAEQKEGRISSRFFESKADLEWARKLIEQMRQGGKGTPLKR